MGRVLEKRQQAADSTKPSAVVLRRINGLLDLCSKHRNKALNFNKYQ
jgi:hypothetical protein